MTHQITCLELRSGRNVFLPATSVFLGVYVEGNGLPQAIVQSEIADMRRVQLLFVRVCVGDFFMPEGYTLIGTVGDAAWFYKKVKSNEKETQNQKGS